MYVPSFELQQHKGQWMCPICLQDSRAEDARMNAAKSSSYKKHDYPMQVHSYEETCERCGRTLVTVYFLNGRKLCETCLGNEQDKWTIVGGEGPPKTPFHMSVERRKKSLLRKFFERVFSEFMGLLGIRWKPKDDEPEIVAVRKKGRSFGNPLVSGRRRAKGNNLPRSEGLIKSKPKKSKKKKQDVSFAEYSGKKESGD